jgi:hypothetical protein
MTARGWGPTILVRAYFSYFHFFLCFFFGGGGDFRHNFAENDHQDLKNGLERRVSQFYTICDKNQLLNTNIEKVTAVLVLRSWDAVPVGPVVPPGSDARWSLES